MMRNEPEVSTDFLDDVRGRILRKRRALKYRIVILLLGLVAGFLLATGMKTLILDDLQELMWVNSKAKENIDKRENHMDTVLSSPVVIDLIEQVFDLNNREYINIDDRYVRIDSMKANHFDEYKKTLVASYKNKVIKENEFEENGWKKKNLVTMKVLRRLVPLLIIVVTLLLVYFVGDAVVTYKLRKTEES